MQALILLYVYHSAKGKLCFLLFFKYRNEKSQHSNFLIKVHSATAKKVITY